MYRTCDGLTQLNHLDGGSTSVRKSLPRMDGTFCPLINDHVKMSSWQTMSANRFPLGGQRMQVCHQLCQTTPERPESTKPPSIVPGQLPVNSACLHAPGAFGPHLRISTSLPDPS